MALKLSLKPGEKFVVNGAVIANGDRRATLVIQNKVSILRERDILQPEQADTPAKRIYFPIMLLYLGAGDQQAQIFQEFVQRMAEFVNAIRDPWALQQCVSINADVTARNYYRALMNCKTLFDFEKPRLCAADGREPGAHTQGLGHVA